MEQVRPAFGTLLRRYRLRAGLSQEALSERARTSVETVGALERGVRRAPYRETVALLAQALDLNDEDCAQLEGAAARPHRSRLTVVPDEAMQGVIASPLHNLPSQLSTLIGREAVVAEVGQLAETHRLVTLLGTGGVGKTRLALQVAANVISGWRDGTWLVEFAPISDPAGVVDSVARVLRVAESSTRSKIESVVEALKRQQLLLVLDNCEHVIAQSREVAVAILHACPNVHIIATSREALHVAGERIYRVPSLEYPDGAVTNSADAAGYAAVALFADRAHAADRTFNINDENVAPVAEICRRLDGIPLAIELAAARVNVLSSSQLAQMLEERLRILTRGDRTAAARQQTMRGTIDWSHDLLAVPERAMFRRLGIFAGGWTLEAVESVCDGAPLSPDSTLDVLSSLVEKSLAVAESAIRGKRFKLLESTRAFALERLDASGERDTVARRHAQWVATFFEEAADAYSTRPFSQWLTAVEPEMDNARAAMDWALGQGDDTTLAGRIAGSPPWRSTATYAEQRRWVEAVLARLDGSENPTIEARLWLTLSRHTDGNRSIEAAQRAIVLFERMGDRPRVASSLTCLAEGQLHTGRLAEGKATIVRALGLLRSLGLTRSSLYAWSLNRSALIELALGEHNNARSLLGESIALCEILGDNHASFVARDALADLEFVEGNLRRALALVEETAQIARQERDPFLLANACMNETALRISLGEFEEAQSSAWESFELFRRLRSPIRLGHAIDSVAILAARNGDLRCAARLRGYVDASHNAIGYRSEPLDRRVQEIFISLLREQLPDAEIESLAAEGALLNEDQAVDMAITTRPIPTETS
ncbi:MAG: helix-turn-helix domain-containing protein [Candidatus Cybelea sp.]